MLKLVGTRLRQNDQHPRSRIKIFWPCEMRSNSRENYQFMEDGARALFIMSPTVSRVGMHSGVLGCKRVWSPKRKLGVRCSHLEKSIFYACRSPSSVIQKVTGWSSHFPRQKTWKELKNTCLTGLGNWRTSMGTPAVSRVRLWMVESLQRRHVGTIIKSCLHVFGHITPEKRNRVVHGILQTPVSYSIFRREGDRPRSCYSHGLCSSSVNCRCGSAPMSWKDAASEGRRLQSQISGWQIYILWYLVCKGIERDIRSSQGWWLIP